MATLHLSSGRTADATLMSVPAARLQDAEIDAELDGVRIVSIDVTRDEFKDLRRTGVLTCNEDTQYFFNIYPVYVPESALAEPLETVTARVAAQTAK